MKNGFYIIVSLLILMACKPSVPKEYIQPGDMEDILYDYHIAQAMAKAHRNQEMDVLKTEYFTAVLKKHGVTEAEFDSSLVYYYSHVKRLQGIYQNVNDRLSDEAKMLGSTVGEIGQYSRYSATGDTASIWKGQTDIMLMPFPAMNRYDFTVEVDTSFYKGDSFSFQFMTEYLWQAGYKDAVVCVVTKYEGDSIIQTSNHVSVSGLSQIRIPANHERKLKEMRGFIYLATGGADDANARRMMFISQVQLIRFHNKEQANETNNSKADSLQRTDNAGRPMPDAIQRGNIGGLRDRPVPAPPGNR